MQPTLLEPTFMVCRSSLHQLCCEEASRSERRYHIGKYLLQSLATDEELKPEDEQPEWNDDAVVRERVMRRVFPNFFGRWHDGVDEHTDGVPRLINALDFVTGFIRPKGTKLFSGITYFFKTLTPVKRGPLKLTTTRPALAVGLRAVLVKPFHTDDGPVEVAVTATACVELKPWDTLIEIGHEPAISVGPWKEIG